MSRKQLKNLLHERLDDGRTVQLSRSREKRNQGSCAILFAGCPPPGTTEINREFGIGPGKPGENREKPGKPGILRSC